MFVYVSNMWTHSAHEATEREKNTGEPCLCIEGKKTFLPPKCHIDVESETTINRSKCQMMSILDIFNHHLFGWCLEWIQYCQYMQYAVCWINGKWHWLLSIWVSIRWFGHGDKFFQYHHLRLMESFDRIYERPHRKYLKNGEKKLDTNTRFFSLSPRSSMEQSSVSSGWALSGRLKKMIIFFLCCFVDIKNKIWNKN